MYNIIIVILFTKMCIAVYNIIRVILKCALLWDRKIPGIGTDLVTRALDAPDFRPVGFCVSS